MLDRSANIVFILQQVLCLCNTIQNIIMPDWINFNYWEYLSPVIYINLDKWWRRNDPKLSAYYWCQIWSAYLLNSYHTTANGITNLVFSVQRNFKLAHPTVLINVLQFEIKWLSDFLWMYKKLLNGVF